MTGVFFVSPLAALPANLTNFATCARVGCSGPHKVRDGGDLSAEGHGCHRFCKNTTETEHLKKVCVYAHLFQIDRDTVHRAS